MSCLGVVRKFLAIRKKCFGYFHTFSRFVLTPPLPFFSFSPVGTIFEKINKYRALGEEEIAIAEDFGDNVVVETLQIPNRLFPKKMEAGEAGLVQTLNPRDQSTT